MRNVTVAALQASYGPDMQANLAKTEKLVRDAAKAGTQIILPSELFQNIYFCTTQDSRWFAEAYPVAEHPCVKHFQPIAKELGVVLPISFFERDGVCHYNSVAVLDADGALLGVYRKTHIPDGPGYQEKFYFKPGDTGYKAWNTRYGKIGVGICWDQWFPECARAMALKGAEILFYPTAIGSEPHDPSLDTSLPWQRAMVGHAVCNAMPVVASNRVGTEQGLGVPQTFYGSSFIANPRGDLVASMDRVQEGCLTATFDLDELDRQRRAEWGFFRDRRAEFDQIGL